MWRPRSCGLLLCRLSFSSVTTDLPQAHFQTAGQILAAFSILCILLGSCTHGGCRTRVHTFHLMVLLVRPVPVFFNTSQKCVHSPSLWKWKQKPLVSMDVKCQKNLLQLLKDYQRHGGDSSVGHFQKSWLWLLTFFKGSAATFTLFVFTFCVGNFAHISRWWMISYQHFSLTT